jgi:hypothetical protein
VPTRKRRGGGKEREAVEVVEVGRTGGRREVGLMISDDGFDAFVVVPVFFPVLDCFFALPEPLFVVAGFFTEDEVPPRRLEEGAFFVVVEAFVSETDAIAGDDDAFFFEAAATVVVFDAFAFDAILPPDERVLRAMLRRYEKDGCVFEKETRERAKLVFFFRVFFF